VHVVAPHGPQALAADGRQRGADRAVEEHIRRLRHGEPEVDRHEWPWFARIIVPVSSQAKRCLSLRVTTAASSSRPIRSPLRAKASSRSPAATQPPGPSSSPICSGACRRCGGRRFETRTIRFSSMTPAILPRVRL